MTNNNEKRVKYDLIWRLINTARQAKGLPITSYNNPYVPKEEMDARFMVIMNG